MSTRRERAKAQNRQAENQLATAVVKPKEKNEFLFELGKYSYDLSKLTFGGVVLVNAFHLSEDNTIYSVSHAESPRESQISIRPCCFGSRTFLFFSFCSELC